MARKFGKKNEVKVSLQNYSYLINGVAGVGKTTVASEIAVKEFGEEGHLVLSIGQEPVPSHIDGVVYERIEDWDKLVDVVDDIVENKATDYQALKMIVIDSCDELFRIAENEVIRLHNKKADMDKRVDSIKMAFGGYNAGVEKAMAIVSETVFKLRDLGISLFFIGHTKIKTKSDLMSDVSYEQITSNLNNNYYNCIKDKVNIVGVAMFKHTYNDVETRKNAFTKKNMDIGMIATEERVICFNDNDNVVDTKSHFRYICSECALESDVIISELKSAMKKQAEIYRGNITDTQFEEMATKEKEQTPQMVVTPKIDETPIKEDKLSKIKSNLTKIDMPSLQGIMKKYGIANFNNAESIDMKALDEILILI